MYYRIFLLVLAAVVFGVLPTGAAGLEEHVYWRVEEQERLPNGCAVITLALEIPEEMSAVPASIHVMLTPWERYGGRLVAERGKVFGVVPPRAEGRYRLRVHSGAFARIQVFGLLRFEGKEYHAQVSMNVFGSAGNVDSDGPQTGSGPDAMKVIRMPDAAEVADWPELRPADTERMIIPQIGQEMRFVLIEHETGHETGSESDAGLRVYKPGTDFTGTAMMRDGVHVFVPPHDSRLDAGGGYGQHADHVFVAEVPERGRVIALTIPVYRAYLGNTSYGMGLSVLGLSAGICWLAVRHFRNRRVYS